MAASSPSRRYSPSPPERQREGSKFESSRHTVTVVTHRGSRASQCWEIECSDMTVPVGGRQTQELVPFLPVTVNG